jgi:hypothetical protein
LLVVNVNEHFDDAVLAPDVAAGGNRHRPTT